MARRARRGGPVSVPAPVAARDGVVVEDAADGVPEPRMVVVFGWIEGVRLTRR